MSDVTMGGAGEPATRAYSVVPNDDNDISPYPRALYVGGAGSIKLTTVGGDVVTLLGAVAGSVLAIRARRIFAAGTTATGIVALY